MKTITETSPATYTFAALRGWKVRFADGKTRRAILVRVHNNESGADYTVRFIEQAGASCSCPHYTQRLAGSRLCCHHIKDAAFYLKHGHAPAVPFASDRPDGSLVERARKPASAPAAPGQRAREAEAEYQAGLYARERGAWEAGVETSL